MNVNLMNLMNQPTNFSENLSIAVRTILKEEKEEEEKKKIFNSSEATL